MDTNKPEYASLGYQPQPPLDVNAVMIKGLLGLVGQIISNFEHIKGTTQLQVTTRAIAFEEMDGWMRTTWREMATAFGVKIPKYFDQEVTDGAIVTEGRSVKPAAL